MSLMKLPEAFETRMQEMLGTEYRDFLQSYEQDRSHSLRYNPLKIGKDDFLVNMPFTLRQVPWAEEGFYYAEDERPGAHILHELGAYYIQEPSAMGVAAVLDPQPGEKILDLCAAPGGKTTHIAGRMQGSGVLISNEIVPGRARILAQNVERMGIRNCIVLNESPQNLEKRFMGYFDRIVVDAPCSGEGMFRKADIAVQEWSPDNVALCAARQKEIMECAAVMLKPGGTMVYSTCTFAPAEDEDLIRWFLQEFPEFELDTSDLASFFSPGRAEDVLKNTMRLWPHKLEGEGHFIAKLRKKNVFETEFAVTNEQSAEEKAKGKVKSKKTSKGNSGKRNAIPQTEACLSILHKELGIPDELLQGNVELHGEQVYLVSDLIPDLSGLKVEKGGLWLGELKKNRFEPSHTLAMTLKPSNVLQHYQMTYEQTCKYFAGETLTMEDDTMKGWVLLTYLDMPAGWGKATGNQIKNHYPKGLRKNLG